MKLFEITAVFPELPAAHAVQTARASGSNYAIAIRRALEEIKRRPQVKGRRIKRAKIVVETVEEIEGQKKG